MARFHGPVSWPGFMARFHGPVSWPGFMARFHGPVSWPGFMARFHGPVSWPGFMARFHGPARWRGAPGWPSDRSAAVGDLARVPSGNKFVQRGNMPPDPGRPRCTPTPRVPTRVRRRPCWARLIVSDRSGTGLIVDRCIIPRRSEMNRQGCCRHAERATPRASPLRRHGSWLCSWLFGVAPRCRMSVMR